MCKAVIINNSNRIILNKKLLDFSKKLEFFYNVVPIKTSLKIVNYILKKCITKIWFRRFYFKRLNFFIYTVLHVHIVKNNIFITLSTSTGGVIFKVTPRIVNLRRRAQKN